MQVRGKSNTVEFSLGPHNAREGWEVARITYDASNPEHSAQLAQIAAAVAEMVKARGERAAPAPGQCRGHERERATP